MREKEEVRKMVVSCLLKLNTFEKSVGKWPKGD